MAQQIYFPTHCIEGVRIEEIPADKADPKASSGPAIVNKTATVVPAKPIRTSLDATVLERFLNARSDDELLAFVEEYGFPCNPQLLPDGRQGVIVSWIRAWQATFGDMLSELKAGNRLKVIGIASQVLEEPIFRMSPHFEYARDGGLAIYLKCWDLRSVMFMELLEIEASGVRIVNCNRCGSVFLTGSGTNRTEKAIYCTDRCRVAASRDRRTLVCVSG